MRKSIKKLMFLACVMILSSTFVFGQGDAGDDPDFPDIPLDGGLSILLVAGAAYGGKKVHDYRSRKNKE